MTAQGHHIMEMRVRTLVIIILNITLVLLKFIKKQPGEIFMRKILVQYIPEQEHEQTRLTEAENTQL